MSTDDDWERWGRQDPYFGVITSDRYRSDRLTPEARAEFFATGEAHVSGVLDQCRALFDPAFAPRRILDFGCGVGRLVIPFARVCEEVVGVDVAQSMLDEAIRNCRERGVANASFVVSDDSLSRVTGRFDLVHSAITLQHIEVERGREIVRRLVELVDDGGVGALQITYGKHRYAESYGQPPEPVAPAAIGPGSRMLRDLRWLLPRFARGGGPKPTVRRGDPQMLMNPYNLSQIAFLIQTAGIPRMHAEFTDHGGELGVFLYFRRPAPGPG